MYNYGSIYSSRFSAGYVYNSGKISASVYSSETTENSGTIDASTYQASHETTNSGYISTHTYSCPKTKNTGKIIISSGSIVTFGTFDLIDKGELNLNGIIIKANELIAPDVKTFLEKTGGTITQNDNSITLKGRFCVDSIEAKFALPHLFSKYSQAQRGYEYIPGDWFSSGYDRVVSHSKETRAQKLWRVTPIDDKYSLKTAAADVFNGKLLHAIVQCDFVPKTKFDVFSKAVVSRDFSKEKACSLKNEKDEKHNHVLIEYICKSLTTKDADFKLLISQALLPKPAPEIGFATQMYNGLKLFFGSAPEVKTEPEPDPNLLDVHKHSYEKTPYDSSKEELIEALKLVINSVSENNFSVCTSAKDKIIDELRKSNCKFTTQEVDEVILPEIAESIKIVQENIQLAAQYVVELESENEFMHKPKLV